MATTTDSKSDAPSGRAPNWTKEEEEWLLETWDTKFDDDELTRFGVTSKAEPRLFEMYQAKFGKDRRTAMAVRHRLFQLTPKHTSKPRDTTAPLSFNGIPMQFSDSKAAVGTSAAAASDTKKRKDAPGADAEHKPAEKKHKHSDEKKTHKPEEKKLKAVAKRRTTVENKKAPESEEKANHKMDTLATAVAAAVSAGDSKAEKTITDALNQPQRPTTPPLGDTHPLPQPATASALLRSPPKALSPSPAAASVPAVTVPTAAAASTASTGQVSDDKDKKKAGDVGTGEGATDANKKRPNTIALPRAAVELLNKLADGTHATLREATAAINKSKTLADELEKARWETRDARARETKAKLDLQCTNELLEMTRKTMDEMRPKFESVSKELTTHTAEFDRARKEYEATRKQHADEKANLQKKLAAREEELRNLKSLLSVREQQAVRYRQEIATLNESLIKLTNMHVATNEFNEAARAASAVTTTAYAPVARPLTH